MQVLRKGYREGCCHQEKVQGGTWTLGKRGVGMKKRVQG